MYFYERKRKGERLQNYHEAAQEMYEKVKRSDDPAVQEHGTRIAHAAMVRAEAQLVQGAYRWDPDRRWDHKEILDS